jgi:hypothetical protein
MTTPSTCATCGGKGGKSFGVGLTAGWSSCQRCKGSGIDDFLSLPEAQKRAAELMEIAKGTLEKAAPSGAVSEEHFRVEVSDHSGQIVAIEPRMLCGRDIGDVERRKIEQAIEQLQGFIGQRRPTEEMRRDAERFRWCQNNPKKAQAMFWNYSSRKDRAKAIDAAISQGGPEG